MGNSDDIIYIDESNNKQQNTQKNKVSFTKKILIVLIILSIIIIPLSFSFLMKSVNLDGQEKIVEYIEVGDIDYQVQLQDNDYYSEKYLEKNMEYVANLIDTIKSKFKYELHLTDTMNLSWKYKITGELLIAKDSDSSPLYTQTINLAEKSNSNVTSTSLNLTEDLDINYDEYNSLVNRYKRDFGLSVNSKLNLVMDIEVEGVTQESTNKLNLKKYMTMSIPLSEQTIKINIDSDEINNNGVLFAKSGIGIENKLLFTISLLLLVISVVVLIGCILYYSKFKKNNIYYVILNKYLNDYDKIIINGSAESSNIDESKYDNIVKVDKFEELVDAAENLSLPILFNEILPGEISLFFVIKDQTLYKYELIRKVLETK